MWPMPDEEVSLNFSIIEETPFQVKLMGYMGKNY